MSCRLDHLAITAPELGAGIEHVRRGLGVLPQAGGEHPVMGTHNALLKLGEACYLEVIAPNPAAVKPQRPRWFELDRQTPQTLPRLATWVVRTDDIGRAQAGASEPLGEIVSLSRGSLRWLITVPADGSLPLGGVAPALIEWHTDRHVASGLQEAGCSLAGLELFHPDAARVQRLLRSLALEGDVAVHALPPRETPYLAARIRTPAGLRRLSGGDPGRYPRAHD